MPRTIIGKGWMQYHRELQKFDDAEAAEELEEDVMEARVNSVGRQVVGVQKWNSMT